jgi:hypothetical protein
MHISHSEYCNEVPSVKSEISDQKSTAVIRGAIFDADI